MMLWNLKWLVFAIPGLLLGIWAQIKLHHAYGKYSQVDIESGQTGAEAARAKSWIRPASTMCPSKRFRGN